MLNKQSYRTLYNQKSKELIGSLPSQADVDVDYDRYVSVVEFMGEEARINFYVNNNGGLDVRYLFENTP